MKKSLALFTALFAFILFPALTNAQSNNTISLSILSEIETEEGVELLYSVNLSHVVTVVDGGAVSIPITVNSSPDATVSGSPVLIPVGEDSGTFTVLLVADDGDEPNEGLNVSIDAGVTGDAINNSGTAWDTLTIYDMDGPGLYVGLDVDSEFIESDEDGFWVYVNTTGDVATYQDIDWSVNFTGDASVAISAAPNDDNQGGAIAAKIGSYDAYADDMYGTIPAGQSWSRFWMSINDDNDQVEDESYEESLVITAFGDDEQSGVAQGAEPSFELTILDDDVFVSLSWDECAIVDYNDVYEGAVVYEAEGVDQETSCNLVASLSHQSPFDVTIGLEFENEKDYTFGPATFSNNDPDADYFVSYDEEMIEAGDEEVSFEFSSLDDDLFEAADVAWINASYLTTVAGSVNGAQAAVNKAEGQEAYEAYLIVVSDDALPTFSLSTTVDEISESVGGLPFREATTANLTYTLEISEPAGEDFWMWVNLDEGASGNEDEVNTMTTSYFYEDADNQDVFEMDVFGIEDGNIFNEDYDDDGFYVLFGAGNSTATFSVAIVNDEIDEDAIEVFNVSSDYAILGDIEDYYYYAPNQSGGSATASKVGSEENEYSDPDWEYYDISIRTEDGSRPYHSVNVLDDDEYNLTLQQIGGGDWDENNTESPEDESRIWRLSLSDNPSPESQVWINVTLDVSGTALVEYDYTTGDDDYDYDIDNYGEMFVSIPPGEAGVIFEFSSYDDDIYERHSDPESEGSYLSYETINLTIVDVESATIDEEDLTLVLELEDDESVPEATFWADDTELCESGECWTQTDMMVALSHPSNQDIYLSVNMTGGTAIVDLAYGEAPAADMSYINSTDAFLVYSPEVEKGSPPQEGQWIASENDGSLGLRWSGIESDDEDYDLEYQVYFEVVNDRHDEDVVGEEPGEWVSFGLYSADDSDVDVAFSNSTASLSIADDDNAPYVELHTGDFEAMDEDDGNGASYEFRAELSNLSVNSIDMGLEYRGDADGQMAQAPAKSFGEADYYYEGTNFTFAAGVGNITFDLAVVDDNIDEDYYGGDPAPGEDVDIYVTQLTNGFLGESSGADVWLYDNDDVPTVYFSIVDSNGDDTEGELEESEGDLPGKDASSEYRWLAELSHRSVNNISLSIECSPFEWEGDTQEGCFDPSKDGHDNPDYSTVQSGTIWAGSTNTSADFYVTNDDLDEWDEDGQVVVNVTSVAAVMDDADEDGALYYEFTIEDDDDPVTFELVQTESLFKDGAVEITENLGNGSDTVNYTVVLSAVSGKSIYFDLAYDGTATGPVGCDTAPAYAGTADQSAAKGCASSYGLDFNATTSLWISAGNMTADFTVTGLSDEYNEGTETSTVTVAVQENVDKSPGDPSAEAGEVTEASFDILDDDKAPMAVDDNIVVAEDGSVSFSVLDGGDANEDLGFSAWDADTDEDFEDNLFFLLGGEILLENDGEVVNATNLVGVVTPPEFGVLTVNVTGEFETQFTYVPNPDYSGLDSFTYLLDDGKGLPSNATVTLHVVGENDKPNSQIDRVSTDEDTAVVIDVLANDFDPDNDALTVTAVAQGDDGEVDGIATLVDGVVTFTPALNFNGVARFEYTISDGSLTDSDPVEVTVVAVNDAPTAVADTVATAFNTPTAPIAVTANDSDVENDDFSVSAVREAGSGTVVDNGDDTITYTPNTGFAGQDGFWYLVEDVHGAVDSVRVVVNVGDNPNNVPVGVADVAEVDSGADVTVTVLANDTDGDEGAVLTVTEITQPADGEGTAVLNEDGTITYTAPAEFVGDVTFTYTVSDGTDSSEGTVTVTVNAPLENQAPDAEDDAGAVTAGESVTIGVLTNDVDPEGAPLTITIITQPADGEGTVTDNGDGTLTYTAPAEFEGDTSFTYTVEDDEGNASTAEVVISVSPDLDGITTEEEDGVDGDGDGSPDGDGNGDGVTDSEQTNVSSLTVRSTSNSSQTGSYITVSVENDGDDTPDDPTDDSTDDTAALSDVQSIENPDPTTFPAGATAPIGFLKFKVTKAEVGAASKVVIRIPEGATVTDYYKYGKTADNQTDHWYKFTYDPVTNTGAKIDNVNRKITLHFVDGLRGDSDLTANGVVDDPGTPVFLTNEAPVAAADAVTIEEDGSATIEVLANDTDADDDLLTIATVSTPANGTAVANVDGTITYTPNAHFNGEDTFTYDVTDNRGETVQATVTVTITSVDDNPVATADEATTDEDTSVMIDIFGNDFHPDGLAFFVVQIADPANGTAVYHNDGTLTYTPDANFAGTETFTYTIGDARGSDSFTEGTVTVVVAGADDAPVGVADASTTDEDTAVTVSVTDNDADPDGDDISVATVTQPANGAVVDNGDGTVTYTPTADFAGSDSFTYTLTDGTNTSAAVEVTVTVTPVNDAPVFAEGDAISTAADPFFLDADYAFDYTAATDVDSNELTYTWEISLASTFAEVTYSAEVSGGSATVTAADLIAALEPLGLTPDSELMVYQRVVANDGELDGSSTAQTITFARASNVSNESTEIPTEYFLSGNYPNPFNPSTTIEFGLPEASDVSIVLFDMTGRQVQVLTSGQLAAGVHTVNVQMGDLPSGLYIYRLVAGSKVFTKTMHMIK